MIIPLQVRFWLTSFSRGQALLRTECFDLFQNCSFSLFCWKHEWIFSPIFTAKTWREPPMSGFPLVFNAQCCSYRASSNSQLQFRFSYPSTGSYISSHSWISAQVSYDDWYLSFSAILRAVVCPVFLAFRDKNCWFFQSVQFLTCYQDGVGTSLLLMCRTESPTWRIFVNISYTASQAVKNSFFFIKFTHRHTHTHTFTILGFPGGLRE